MVAANMRVKVVAWPLAIASSLLYGCCLPTASCTAKPSLQLFFVAVPAGAGGNGCAARHLTAVPCRCAG
jgi:hypothetical protein